MTQYKVNQETYAHVFKLLFVKPVSVQEIVEVSGIHKLTAYELLRCFKKHGLVHISGWTKDTLGRDSMPIYKMGKGEDTPRTRMTDSERSKRYLVRKKERELLNLTYVRSKAPAVKYIKEQ